ncbi:unnamed protein product [Rangifer tarandus platyrhynchus]|uniref:Secreted protein n=1 Tax=Rangifer tarandus platyrhynchus TaxID=3082113 RepID=A0ABN8Y8Z5_RANTA|nr:unnamed protein product [Rangifer tarandus platyrhynchus]
MEALYRFFFLVSPLQCIDSAVELFAINRFPFFPECWEPEGLGTSGILSWFIFAFSIGNFLGRVWPDFRLILPVSVRGAEVDVWFQHSFVGSAGVSFLGSCAGRLYSPSPPFKMMLLEVKVVRGGAANLKFSLKQN